MLGGLLLGVIESLAQGYLSTNFADTITFILLITFMLFRPNGILGRPMMVKV
jgi:branched-chain amino acid transport system permease protein